MAFGSNGDMFEGAQREVNVEKSHYHARLRDLRTELLAAQRRLVGTGRAVIVLVNGVEGAGKGEVVNLLGEWLDARHLSVHAFDVQTEEESHRPRYWRYWMALPERGQIGIIMGNWYSQPIVRRAFGESDADEFDAELSRIEAFERGLAADGVVFVKLWLHISKKRQKRRFEKLLDSELTRGHVTKRERRLVRHYDAFLPVTERALGRTSTAFAPWVVVDAARRRHRNLVVGEALLSALQGAPDAVVAAPPAAARFPDADSGGVLEDIDLGETVPREEYEHRLSDAQNRLRTLGLKANAQGLSTILVFEGWDAAGKGGAIRRLLQGLDVRQCRAIPIAAPTEEERAHHYLWRFWRHLPRRGRFTIYDRSWYGRVLVERVEGFAQPAEWQRAYQEINEFEEQLVQHGIVLCKFWLHISQEQQLRRFKEREAIPWKRHKISEEDYRNREKAADYSQAVCEMVARTSLQRARWNLVSAECKRHARLTVLDAATSALAEALGES